MLSQKGTTSTLGSHETSGICPLDNAYKEDFRTRLMNKSESHGLALNSKKKTNACVEESKDKKPNMPSQ